MALYRQIQLRVKCFRKFGCKLEWSSAVGFNKKTNLESERQSGVTQVWRGSCPWDWTGKSDLESSFPEGFFGRVKHRVKVSHDFVQNNQTWSEAYLKT